jgi:hypothetical protein
MTHRIGTMNTIAPHNIGPDSGPPTAPNTWAFAFNPTPAPAGTKFVILHFTGAAFPAANRLEVDLGYDMDVFNAAAGPDFWTRPIKVPSSNAITMRYITAGAAAGTWCLLSTAAANRWSPSTPPTPKSQPHESRRFSAGFAVCRAFLRATRFLRSHTQLGERSVCAAG